MDKNKVVKAVVRFATSTTTGYFVGCLVKAVMPPPVGLLVTIVTVTGRSLLTAYMADRVSKFVLEEIEETKNDLKEIKDKILQPN